MQSAGRLNVKAVFQPAIYCRAPNLQKFYSLFLGKSIISLAPKRNYTWQNPHPQVGFIVYHPDWCSGPQGTRIGLRPRFECYW